MTTEIVTDNLGHKRKVPKEFEVKIEGYLDAKLLVELKQALVLRYAEDVTYQEAVQHLVVKAIRDKGFW